jgi:flagellar biosynthesis/type III secretory pathway chaperone
MQRERCLIIEVVNHELANIMEGIDKEKAIRWVLGDENLVAQKLIKLKQQIAKEIEVENLALEEISRLRKGDEKSLEDIKT